LLFAAVAAVLLWRGVQPRPEVVLWVWERPEDLSRAGPDVRFAVLAKSIELDGSSMRVRPRMQPVELPAGADATSVVRIDATGEFSPSPALVRDVARQIANDARPLQVDFDARVSERAFYRDVLHEVRRIVGTGRRVSITALASWCLGDPWIRELPIDEAVPMIFQMGPDDAAVRAHLASGGDFSLPVCRTSVGLSLDEPVFRVPRARTLYFFSPKPWTPERIAMARNGRVLE
jgi:hypothetical protein